MQTTSSAQEERFVRAFPGYAAVLDPDRERAHIRRRLETVARREDPFPHVWVEDVLSPELYDVLDAAWPHIDQFPAEEREDRRDLVPAPPGTNPKDARTSTYHAMPAPMRAVWHFFVLDVNRGIIGPWLGELFKAEIDARLDLIERLWRDRRAVKRYYEPPYRPQMNVGRLMMRAQGYQLRPHADALPYLVTALFYFPDELETAELGTTLYRTAAPMPEDVIADSGRTVYFDKTGIDTSESFSAPFRRNSLLAFANTDRSAHGMEISTPGVWRRAYQSHLSIKSDRDHL